MVVLCVLQESWGLAANQSGLTLSKAGRSGSSSSPRRFWMSELVRTWVPDINGEEQAALSTRSDKARAAGAAHTPAQVYALRPCAASHLTCR